MDITVTNMKSGQNPVIKPEQANRDQRKLETIGQNVPSAMKWKRRQSLRS